MERRRRRRAAGAGFCCCCGFSILVLLGLISLVVVIPLVYVRTQTTTASTEIITTAPALILEISLMLSEQLHLGENEMLNPGDRIFYTVVVLNTGTAPLVNATIDSSYPLLGCTLPETLFPGQNYTCMGVRTINLDDILQGSVNLTVTVDTETETIMTDLTRVTMPDLTVNVCGMPNFENDTVELMIKIFNSGSATLLNVTYNGEIVFEELLPMEMEILARIFNQTTTNFTTVVTAIDITSEQVLERVVETVVDLTEPVVAALSLSDRVGEAPLDTTTSYIAPFSLSGLGFTEFPSCLSTLSYFEHEINITNVGNDVIYNVTTDTWLQDARATLSEMIAVDRFRVWTIDCAPMFMTNVIPVLFPGETQTCRVLYHTGTGVGVTVRPLVDTNMDLFGYSSYYARQWGFNMTRITNASTTGVGHTNNSNVFAVTDSTEVILKGATLLPVGRVSGTPFLTSMTLLPTNVVASSSVPIQSQWPYSFHNIVAIEYYESGLCREFIDQYNLERNGPGGWNLVSSAFQVDARHQQTYLRFNYDLPSFTSASYTFPAYQVQIQTIPANLRDTWVIESKLATNINAIVDYDPMTGTISNPMQTLSNGGTKTAFVFRIGDLRQYTSITVSGAEIPLLSIPSGHTLRPYFGFSFLLEEEVTLVPVTDDSRDLGFNYTFY